MLNIDFEFSTATRIIFGPGRLNQVGSLAKEMGTRVLVVRGGSANRVEPLLNILADFNLPVTQIVVQQEPTIEFVRQVKKQAHQTNCDLVIGFGGGSVIDTGKAIAALLTNPGEIFDYLEVIGKGKPLKNPSVAYIAIPTTAGTGAEVTRNAVLGSPEHRVKVSLRSPLMFPRLALVDPELTYTMPPEITASTGLDALTQLIEPYVSIDANPLTDAICRQGMRHAARSLRLVYEDGDDADARIDLSIASMFSGMALANAKLGAVHGFAGTLGGMIHAHGAICARLLPVVMEVNLRAMRDRSPDNKILQRYADVAKILTGSDLAKSDDGVKWLNDLCLTFGVPPLRYFGLTTADFPQVIESSNRSSSMKGNPVKLSTGELHEILDRAL